MSFETEECAGMVDTMLSALTGLKSSRVRSQYDCMDAAVRRPGGSAMHGAVTEKDGEKWGLRKIRITECYTRLSARVSLIIGTEIFFCAVSEAASRIRKILICSERSRE